MKKYLSPSYLLIVMAFLLANCSDKVEITKTYTVYEPVYMTLEEVRSAVDIIAPKEIDVPGKIYIYKNYLLVNEPGKGIHIFNNQNPSQPKNLKFINIPGNYDMAVRGDVLYADSFMDLVAFNISDINNVEVLERLESIFMNIYIDGVKGVLAEYKEVKKVDISEDEYGYAYPYFYRESNLFMSMSMDAAWAKTAFAAPSVSTGIGGSMARFTIVNNYLYTIDNQNLYTFDISNLKQPVKDNQLNIGWGIETIFPYKNNLFFGSTTGMIIYDITTPNSPEFVSTFSHVRRCDPVVVQDDLAYVTLRGGNECGGFTNQLDVVNVKDLTKPFLVKTYPMVGPYGLGIDGNTLFVCDGTAGLKVYNASDPLQIDKHMIKTYSNIDAYDVIPYNDLLIMTGKDGIHQFDYSNPANITLKSKITIGNK